MENSYSTYHYNYYHNNPEKREKILAQTKAYVKNRYATDPEFRNRVKAQSKQWAIDNRERKNQLVKNWQKKHYVKLLDYQRRYKAGELDNVEQKIEFINTPRTITF